MEKTVKVNVHSEDAVLITADLTHFNGDVQSWKSAVYELFRCNMTWSFAHEIDVRESNKDGVFVSLIIKPEFEKNALAAMEDLGFKDAVAHHEDIGWIECTDMPNDMLLDYVYIDY